MFSQKHIMQSTYYLYEQYKYNVNIILSDNYFAVAVTTFQYINNTM